MGEVFNTFSEFNTLFKQYQAETKHVYVSKNTITVAYHNRRTEQECQLPENCRYKAIQYQCKLFTNCCEQVPKGTGARPNQRWVILLLGQQTFLQRGGQLPRQGVWGSGASGMGGPAWDVRRTEACRHLPVCWACCTGRDPLSGHRSSSFFLDYWFKFMISCRSESRNSWRQMLLETLFYQSFCWAQ